MVIPAMGGRVTVGTVAPVIQVTVGLVTLVTPVQGQADIQATVV